MRLCSLASGSSGNSVLIQSDHATILIDAGYSAKRIESLLRAVGVHPKNLDAILVTHEHSDHIAGLGVLTRRLSCFLLRICTSPNPIPHIPVDSRFSPISPGITQSM